jgi:hypothetical protein
MLETPAMPDKLVQKRQVFVRCLLHHTKSPLSIGCPICNRTNSHARSFISANTFGHDSPKS